MKTIRNVLLLALTLLFITEFYAQRVVNQFNSNGEKTGKWEKKYANGNYRYKGQFLNGKEIGTFYFYTEFNSATPAIIKEFNNQNHLCNVRFYTKTGVLESQGEMMKRDRVGQWLYFAPDGKRVVLEENYKAGKLSGPVKVYYPDGSLTEEVNYLNGLMHGQSIRYTDQGKLVSKIPYAQGKIHGKVYYYDENGIIRETGHYQYGKRVGRWEFYVDGVLTGVEEPNKKKPRDTISKPKSKKN